MKGIDLINTDVHNRLRAKILTFELKPGTRLVEGARRGQPNQPPVSHRDRRPVLTLALPLDVVLPSATDLAWLAAMASCWTGAQWLVVAAYSRHPPPSVAPYAYSQLVWATLLGAAFSQQWPTTATLFGAAVIVVAGLGAARATSNP